MVDYASKLYLAEKEIAKYIDVILTQGGHDIWQKYLQRKAYPFAADSGIEALTSKLKMCFVTHEEADTQQDWMLEEEPVPAEVDNWARMHLTVRRPQRREPGYESLLLGKPRGDNLRKNNRSRVSDSRARRGAQSRNDKAESKSWGIQDASVVVLDAEEEKLREAKAQEEARRREKENKLRLAEKDAEREQRRVQALHEEMAAKKHTFDSDGNIIWCEEIKLDRLPKVQEVFPYGIKKDPRSRDRLEETMAGKVAPSPTAKKKIVRQSRRFDRSGKKKQEEDDFPDGFSKLKHGQPPIIETMIVKPGVVLDDGRKQKAGPAVRNSGGGMSRKDYVAWTEQEGEKEATFSQFGDGGDGNADRKGDGSAKEPGGALRSSPKPGSPKRPGTAGAPGGASASASPTATVWSAQEAPGLGDTLPPIGGRNPKVGGLGGSRQGTFGSRPSSAPGGQVQKAPSAPPMHVRQKKMEAVGHLGRHPRLHIAPLGGPYGFSAAQPPLGATMGHGLLRSGSTKEAYFFPSSNPEVPQLSSMLRSQSEAQLPKERSYISAPGSREDMRTVSRDGMGSREAPTTARSQKEDEELARKNGMIIPERKSPAYRGVRQTLFPHAGDTGLSQYGAVYT